jgi:hypothetical protein
VNNYNIDATTLVSLIAQQEQAKLISLLVSANVMLEEDGVLSAVAYENWADRKEEGHQPNMVLKQVSGNE